MLCRNGPNCLEVFVLCRNGPNCHWTSKKKKSNDNCGKCKVGLGEDDEEELRRCCVASWLAQTLSFCPVANGRAHLASLAHAAIMQRLYELLFILDRSRLLVCKDSEHACGRKLHR